MISPSTTKNTTEKYFRQARQLNISHKIGLAKKAQKTSMILIENLQEKYF